MARNLKELSATGEGGIHGIVVAFRTPERLLFQEIPDAIELENIPCNRSHRLFGHRFHAVSIPLLKPCLAPFSSFSEPL